MKILIISPYLPHPQCGHGGGVFIYGMIKHLMYRHELTLVSFCDKKELVLSKDLIKLPLECYFIPRGKGARKNLLWNLYLVVIRLFQLLRSILFWQPYYVSKWRHPRMARLIQRLTSENRYDIVQFEYTQMGQYLKFVKSGKTFLHEIDVSFRPAYRRYKNSAFFLTKMLAYIEWCRWALYESKIVRRFNHILSVTDQDRMLLEWLSGMKHISYLPHAIDVPEQIPEYSEREPLSLLFLGTFAHYPNVDAVVWLCKEIFPIVLKQYPNVKLYIVGPRPPQVLYSVAKQFGGIKILGFVEDINVYLQKCSIFVAPMRFGGGIKNKILYAMAHGIPVVTTKFGIEGIDGVGHDVALVGNSTQVLAKHICRLLEDSTLAIEFSKKGWEIMKEKYSWQSVVTRLEKIYQNILL